MARVSAYDGAATGVAPVKDGAVERSRTTNRCSTPHSARRRATRPPRAPVAPVIASLGSVTVPPLSAVEHRGAAGGIDTGVCNVGCRLARLPASSHGVLTVDPHVSQVWPLPSSTAGATTIRGQWNEPRPPWAWSCASCPNSTTSMPSPLSGAEATRRDRHRVVAAHLEAVGL